MNEESNDSAGRSWDRHQTKRRTEAHIGSPLGTTCSYCGAGIDNGGDKLGAVVQLGEISW